MRSPRSRNMSRRTGVVLGAPLAVARQQAGVRHGRDVQVGPDVTEERAACHAPYALPVPDFK